MKKYLFTVLSFVAVTALHAQAPDWGVADTLAHHPLGPGIEFTHIHFLGANMLVWVTEIDLSNPYNKIEQVQSRHSVPDVKRWTVQEHFAQNTYENHRVCVAFNHDFFTYEGGVCIGLNVSEGEVAYGGGWGRSLLAITEEKEAVVFLPNLEANVVLPDGDKIRIDCFNSQELGLSGDCIFFNRMNARTLADAGKYIQVQPQAQWTVNGDDIPCKVLAISDTPLQTSQTAYVIYLRGEKLTAADGKLQVGDVLHISQKLTAGGFGVAPENILNAFHGYPSIAYEGKLHDGEYNNFENGREYEISSRQMAGISKDGKTLYMVTTEMSTRSKGVNCIDVANYMLAHGAWNVVNFDSGGSTAIVVDNEMLNLPARGSVRPVEDAMLAVSLAPESKKEAAYHFLTPATKMSVAATKQLTLLSFNEYDEVVNRQAEGFTFRCEPEQLGYIDEQQVFHAGIEGGEGVIVAEKDGKQARMRISVMPAEQLNITPEEILIDGVREYPIQVEAIVGGEAFLIDPSALQWTVEDETVCTVKDGVLRGLDNGTTMVKCMFTGQEKTLEVTVEKGQGVLTAETMDDLSGFEVGANGPENLIITHEGLPAGWTHGSMLDFNYVMVRFTNIELTKDVRFYGIPDSVSFMLHNDNGVVSDVEIIFRNSSNENVFAEQTVAPDGTQRVVIPFSDENGPWDIRQFPITLKSITLYLDKKEKGEHFSVGIGNLCAHYPEGATDIALVPADAPLRAYITDAGLQVDYELAEPAEVNLRLYSLDGQMVCSHAKGCVPAGSYHETLPLIPLAKGVYVLHLQTNRTKHACKIIL